MPHSSQSPARRLLDAIARLRVYEPDHLYQLNPVVCEIEHQIWMSLEHQCGYSLPEIYSRFVFEVGNGGRWGTVFKYLSVSEVFDNNDGELYRQPPPAFVEEALILGELVCAPRNGRDPLSGFPGLLRVTEFSYNMLACYLTANNECVQIEVHGDDLSVTAQAMTAEAFFEELLEDVRKYGHLDQYERTR